MTAGMDSIIHMKLLYQVLPRLGQGSAIPTRSGQGYSDVLASNVPGHRVKAPVGEGPTLSPPSETQPRAAPGRCQVPNYSSS